MKYIINFIKSEGFRFWCFGMLVGIVIITLCSIFTELYDDWQKRISSLVSFAIGMIFAYFVIKRSRMANARKEKKINIDDK